MDGATANARRKYHHVHHGGKLTERDIAGMVRGMENKDAEIARLTTERDTALARASAAALEMRERAADCADIKCSKHGQYSLAQSCRDAIRALPIDPDAQQALDKMLAKAREDAIREAAAIVNKNRDISGWVSHDAILALLNDGVRDE